MVIKNIIKGWYYKLFDKESYLAQKRMEICSKCEYRIKILNEDICDLCGCVLDAKCRVKEEKCYNNKW